MTTDGTSISVYAERLRRAQAELERQGVDLLLIGPGSDLFYLTGFVAHLSERLNLLGLPRRRAGLPVQRRRVQRRVDLRQRELRARHVLARRSGVPVPCRRTAV